MPRIVKSSDHQIKAALASICDIVILEGRAAACDAREHLAQRYCEVSRERIKEIHKKYRNNTFINCCKRVMNDTFPYFVNKRIKDLATKVTSDTSTEKDLIALKYWIAKKQNNKCL